ncbi:nicotinate-nicotinamide nucleotide adenylyltransferase [Myxococcota bacterium]|jgi:nicotinate-nucleotide adenylyltransferase|nr:nicotinate-nicotinamide nucleotide adenylyltransferase [Myxococcota bacterium]
MIPEADRHVAIFGGSFDPPHVAHVMAVAWALSCTPCRQVLVLPCYEHPLGKQGSPFEARVAMARAAFRPFGHRAHVSMLEARLPRPSFTIQTVRRLVALNPGTRFHLLLGTDILDEQDHWRSFDELMRLAPPFWLARGGPDPRAHSPVLPAVSSTEIRSALLRGEDVSNRVPLSVLEEVRRWRLYSAEGSG